MKASSLSLRFLLPAALLLGAHDASSQDSLRLNLRRVSERVVVTWACDHFQGTNTVVLATDSGLVVVDPGLSVSTARRQRALIERELGRSDFRFLVNTHVHNDHAFASSVYPEAEVVGPRAAIAALRREVELLPQLLERLRRAEASYKEGVAHTSPDSVSGKLAREGVAAFAVGIADLERGVEPRYPTRTFDGRLTLPLGNVTLELFEFQGLHSDADILILVPEEGLLLTGDVFWEGQLPMLRGEGPGEAQRLLGAWQAVLESPAEMTRVIPGHSDVPMSMAFFRATHAYLLRLAHDVQAARSARTPLTSFLMQHAFAERYPEVAQLRVLRRDYNLHQHNVYVLWYGGGPLSR